MPILDTLKLARRLQDAGFTSQQATGAAEALSEIVFPDIATKGDLQTEIAQLRAEMRGEFAAVRTGLATEIAAVRTELAKEIAAVRTEIAAVRTEIAAVRTEVAGVKVSIAQWIVGAMFVNVLTLVGAVAAVWQLAGHHP